MIHAKHFPALHAGWGGSDPFGESQVLPPFLESGFIRLAKAKTLIKGGGSIDETGCVHRSVCAEAL